MTDPYISEVAETGEDGPKPDWQNLIYEVFNSDYSVGVACDRRGVIVGLHLGDEVWENTDSWLAAEILRISRLAHLKSQVGRRAEMLYNGVGPHVADAYDYPTEAQYAAIEKAELDRGH